MEEFYRIRRLPPYVFEQVNRAKAAARNAGADIIDLGMGNPDLPAPAHVLEKLKEVAGKPRTDRYSSSRGIPGLRKAQASYYGRRFGVKLNPETQVVATLGSKEGFAIIEDLAGLLGAAVGCSRAVTSAGWRPHSDQVGQTGTKVAPEVYIACGISGATQHMAGLKGAKRILAINSDPQAPLMLNADYTVTGDLKEIVPAISAEIRRARAGRTSS